VIPVRVEIENREVQSWSQPMVQPVQDGLCAFVCRKINGILHVAMQLKLECGNHDVVELAPTVQTITGNYRTTSRGKIPFLDYVLEAPQEQIVYDTLQSEEGGRFYQEQNRNMIVILPDQASKELEETFPFYSDLYGELPENYIWMTINQVIDFMRFNNFVNIQARSLVAAISFS